MASKVFMVDEKTRLILPESQWANDVLASLRSQGHQVYVTGQDPNLDDRDEAELARRDELLDSTGL